MTENENILTAPDGEREVGGKTPDEEKLVKRRKRGGKILVEKWIFFACALISILAVAAIVVFILINSIPALAEIGVLKFIFGTEWYPNGYHFEVDPATGEMISNNASEVFGILPMIVCSIIVTLLSLLCGGVLGVSSALFVVYWCHERFKKVVVQLINVFAGIPSVIYGFFGLVFIIPILRSFAGNGFGIMACMLVLMLMILPTIASMSKNALESVPANYFEGAIALGMTKEQAIFTVMLPAAKSGIISGLIMGTGRAVGEAMAVALVCGGSPSFPDGLFSNIRTMTSSIALEMSYASGIQRNALIATGLVLLIFVLILNFIISRINRDNNGGGKPGKSRSRGRAKTDGGAVMCVAGDAAGSAACVVSRATAVAVPEYRKKGLFSNIAKYACYFFTCFAGVCLVVLVGFILVNGLPNLASVFDVGAPGQLGVSNIVQFGNALFGTLVLIVLTLAIALPLGICAAVYLHEYAKPGSKIVKAIRLFNDTLGGVPSIVFGLFGNIVFVVTLGMSNCILAGTFTMVLIILPTIIRSVEESLIAVPDSLREASLALGATKFRTIWKVVLPQALAGILTAAVLSIGRIVGESAALIYTMGSTRAFLPTGLVGRGNASCTLTVYMYILASDGQEIGVAYGIAVILLFIVALVYVGLGLIEYFGKKEKGAKKCKEKIKPAV